MLNFCTLFDINFITQGVSMYESLKANCPDFHLYILAFCDESYKVLSDLNLENVTIISLKEFENDELLKIKPKRSKAEYCWTCGSSSILYCINKFDLQNCTYVDADTYFYSNPKVLIDEMGDKSVLITEHRYSPEVDQTSTSGRYCVQFMTFKNTPQGLNVLNWWVDKCLEWCYAKFEDGRFGDQKYLDDWLERFDCVHSLVNLGGGVAPWNFNQYKFFKKDKVWFIKEISSSKEYPIIFYHYHDIKVNKDGYFDGNRYFSYKKTDTRMNPLYKDYTKAMKKCAHQTKQKIKGLRFDFKMLRKSIIQIKFGKNGYLKLFGKEIFNNGKKN